MSKHPHLQSDYARDPVNLRVEITPIRQRSLIFLEGILLTHTEVCSDYLALRPITELSFIPIVPVEAPIFEAVLWGNLLKVKELVYSGQASVHDQLSIGCGLLHVSICLMRSGSCTDERFR